VNTNNGVKGRRFIVPKKVEQINDHLLMSLCVDENDALFAVKYQNNLNNKWCLLLVRFSSKL